jgi:hypothetical protein
MSYQLPMTDDASSVLDQKLDNPIKLGLRWIRAGEIRNTVREIDADAGADMGRSGRQAGSRGARWRCLSRSESKSR